MSGFKEVNEWTEGYLERMSATVLLALRGSRDELKWLISHAYEFGLMDGQKQVRGLQEMNSTEPLAHDAEGVAQALDVSIPTAKRLIYDGSLPSFKIRGCRRVSSASLRRYIEEKELEAG